MIPALTSRESGISLINPFLDGMLWNFLESSGLESGKSLLLQKYSRPGNSSKAEVFPPGNSLISDILHCKKELAVFPSPAGMSLIKLFLGGKFPAQREFGQ